MKKNTLFRRSGHGLSGIQKTWMLKIKFTAKFNLTSLSNGCRFPTGMMQRGVTLIELMIALTLGLFLLAGVVAIYLGDKKTYQYSQSLARMQENGRIATEWLSRDLRMAGFIGCGRLSEIKPENTDLTLEKSLVGWHMDQTTSSLSLPKLSAERIKNSDMVLMQMADAQTVKIISAHAHTIKFAEKPRFKVNTSLLISDCQQAEKFNFGNVDLKYEYQKDAEVGELHKIIYYVANTGRKNKAGQFINALYRQDLNASIGKSSELVEGIESLQVQYGIKGANNLPHYFFADAVSNWGKVRNIKINLLLSSIENLEGKRLLRSWSFIVALREREE